MGDVNSKQKHSFQEKHEDSPSAKTDANSLRRDFDGLLRSLSGSLMVSTSVCLGFKQQMQRVEERAKFPLHWWVGFSRSLKNRSLTPSLVTLEECGSEKYATEETKIA